MECGMQTGPSFDRQAWLSRCEALAEQANSACGLVYEIYERNFTGAINRDLQRLDQRHRGEVIEMAKNFGWATAEELAETQRLMDGSGCCSHGLDPDCCPAGCGDPDNEVEGDLDVDVYAHQCE